MRSSSVLVSLLLLPLSTFAVPLPPAGVVAGTAEAEAARLAEAQAAWAERTRGPIQYNGHWAELEGRPPFDNAPPPPEPEVRANWWDTVSPNQQAAAPAAPKYAKPYGRRDLDKDLDKRGKFTWGEKGKAKVGESSSPPPSEYPPPAPKPYDPYASAQNFKSADVPHGYTEGVGAPLGSHIFDNGPSPFGNGWKA